MSNTKVHSISKCRSWRREWKRGVSPELKRRDGWVILQRHTHKHRQDSSASVKGYGGQPGQPGEFESGWEIDNLCS